MKEFKVGDIVVYVGNEDGSPMSAEYLGRVGIVVEVDDAVSENSEVVIDYFNGDRKYTHYAFNFELFKMNFEVEL